jgi:hypothetical protein
MTHDTPIPRHLYTGDSRMPVPARTRWETMRIELGRVPWKAAAAAVPVVLVNAVAFAGQLAFLHAHLPWPAAGQVLLAVTLESVAVYLAFHAHLAQMANDSALRLRLAAYGFAVVIGLMNYSHYAGPGWRPTFAAVALGLMSAASPWLWSVHSRRLSRDVLLKAGLIEPHAVRLGGTRWVWHPYRSARVMRAATWDGERDPVKAIATVYPAAEPERQVSLPRWTDAQSAAIDAQIRATEAGHPFSPNALQTKYRLSRAETTKVVELVESMTSPVPSLNGHHGGAGRVLPPAEKMRP